MSKSTAPKPTIEELLARIVEQNTILISQGEGIIERLDYLEERIKDVGVDYGDGFQRD